MYLEKKEMAVNEEASMEVKAEGGEAHGAGEGPVVQALEVAFVKVISKGFGDVLNKLEGIFDVQEKAMSTKDKSEAETQAKKLADDKAADQVGNLSNFPHLTLPKNLLFLHVNSL